MRAIGAYARSGRLEMTDHNAASRIGLRASRHREYRAQHSGRSRVAVSARWPRYCSSLWRESGQAPAGKGAEYWPDSALLRPCQWLSRYRAVERTMSTSDSGTVPSRRCGWSARLKSGSWFDPLAYVRLSSESASSSAAVGDVRFDDRDAC